MTRSTSPRIPSDKKRKMHELINLYIQRISDTEWKFNGVTEQQIADEVGISLWSVQNHRRQFFGKLANEEGDESTPMGRAWAHIRALEQSMAELKAKVALLGNEQNFCSDIRSHRDKL